MNVVDEVFIHFVPLAQSETALDIKVIMDRLFQDICNAYRIPSAQLLLETKKTDGLRP